MINYTKIPQVTTVVRWHGNWQFFSCKLAIDKSEYIVLYFYHCGLALDFFCRIKQRWDDIRRAIFGVSLRNWNLRLDSHTRFQDLLTINALTKEPEQRSVSGIPARSKMEKMKIMQFPSILFDRHVHRRKEKDITNVPWDWSHCYLSTRSRGVKHTSVCAATRFDPLKKIIAVSVRSSMLCSWFTGHRYLSLGCFHVGMQERNLINLHPIGMPKGLRCQLHSIIFFPLVLVFLENFPLRNLHLSFLFSLSLTCFA